MKIALLGAGHTGKTSYFSGVYHQFRNVVSFGRRDESVVGEELSFRISLRDAELERDFILKTIGFDEVPLEFPSSTVLLEDAEIDVSFHFRSAGELRVFDRAIHILDPQGGVVAGLDSDTEYSIDELITCDSFIVFLDATHILTALKRGDRYLRNKSAFGRISEILERVRDRIDPADVIPICIVISKSDEFNENVIKDVREMLYEDIVIPFSQYYSSYLIAVCPISIINPTTREFMNYNLNWPFIFSCAGTIFRNALISAREAEGAERDAVRAERRAEEVDRGGWWKKITAYISGTGKNASLERARRYRDRSGRLIETSETDRELARKLWSVVQTGGEAAGVRVFKAGEEFSRVGEIA